MNSLTRTLLIVILVSVLLPVLAFAQLGASSFSPFSSITQTGLLQSWPLILSQLGFIPEGDPISAVEYGDYDVYVVNEHGFKRLFLNPVIFSFYGHLFGFPDVTGVTPDIRDLFATSGLFRNCETNDERVFGLTVHGEDVGALHWIDTTGEQAVIDDPDFFKKVFCINQREFDWYPKGQTLYSVNDIPDYARGELTLGDVPGGGFLEGVTGEGITQGGGGGGGGGGGIASQWQPTDDCPGGGGRVPGLPTCFMPEDLTGSVWNLVSDATGDILNEVVCSVIVCGPNGEHRVLLNYPVGATYIQSPFNVGYSGKYFTNGVWQTGTGGTVQPGSEQIQ